MKTTSSYSSLAFAAFFKGKKSKKCQAAETGEVGGRVGETTGYWILQTASCQGREEYAEGGSLAGGTEPRAICKCHTFCQSIKMMSQCMKNT